MGESPTGVPTAKTNSDVLRKFVCCEIVLCLPNSFPILPELMGWSARQRSTARNADGAKINTLGDPVTLGDTSNLLEVPAAAVINLARSSARSLAIPSPRGPSRKWSAVKPVSGYAVMD